MVVGKCINVTVGAPINKSETIIAGETLDHLASFFGFSLDDFIVVAKGSDKILFDSSVIETDTVLKLCHRVLLLSNSGSRGFLVEHQHSLQSNTDLVKRAQGYHLVVGIPFNKTELLLTHIVEHNLYIVLCSLVTATGVINTTVLVESETQHLGKTVLKDYFDPRQFYTVRDASNASRFYSFNDTITRDITVVITDQCGSLNKPGCQNTSGVCKWNKNGVCARAADNYMTRWIVCTCTLWVIALTLVTIDIVLIIRYKKRDNRKTELATLALPTTPLITRQRV